MSSIASSTERTVFVVDFFINRAMSRAWASCLILGVQFSTVTVNCAGVQVGCGKVSPVGSAATWLT
jgi:hypothetical protein